MYLIFSGATRLEVADYVGTICSKKTNLHPVLGGLTNGYNKGFPYGYGLLPNG